ncbi:MAG: hypothetical protein ACLU4J_19185 [Butyricimonas paravirosa]
MEAVSGATMSSDAIRECEKSAGVLPRT